MFWFQTPLHLAASCGADAVEILLWNGANINGQNVRNNSFGETYESEIGRKREWERERERLRLREKGGGEREIKKLDHVFEWGKLMNLFYILFMSQPIHLHKEKCAYFAISLFLFTPTLFLILNCCYFSPLLYTGFSQPFLISFFQGVWFVFSFLLQMECKRKCDEEEFLLWYLDKTFQHQKWEIISLWVHTFFADSCW